MSRTAPTFAASPRELPSPHNTAPAAPIASSGEAPGARRSSPLDDTARLRNPFLAGLTRADGAYTVAPDAARDSFTYAMVQSGPAVSAAEAEQPDREVVEVMILWGRDVLHVSHLRVGQGFVVGEPTRGKARVDFLLPAARLGVAALPVVVASDAGASVVVPAAATGGWRREGVRRSLDEARRDGVVSTSLPGATEIRLAQGVTIHYSLGGFTLQVTMTRAGRKLPRALLRRLDTAFATSFGVSLAAMASLVATIAATTPTLALTTEEGLDRSQLRLVMQLLDASGEREQSRREEAVRNDDEAGTEGGEGTRAKLEEGAMGRPDARTTGGRWGAAGSAAAHEVQLSRAAALQEAQSFGMLGILQAAAGGDPNAPTVPWGGDFTIGADPVSARGAMWGDEIGDSIGGGLGLTGIGEGGGGRGEGIGLGDVGTYGHGTGCRSGDARCGQGIGTGHGRLGGTHHTRPAVLRTANPTLSGRLPPEVIQRIVRQNFGRFRLCYERGLAQNPNLAGRVAVRFVIDSTGAVSHAANGGSDLPHSGAVACVVSSFYSLSFPAPEHGIVSVVYPILFEPG